MGEDQVGLSISIYVTRYGISKIMCVRCSIGQRLLIRGICAVAMGHFRFYDDSPGTVIMSKNEICFTVSVHISCKALRGLI